MPRLKMCGAIPPLPNMSLWHGAYLSTGTTLPLTFSVEDPYIIISI
jgi:hypothetical protein